VSLLHLSSISPPSLPQSLCRSLFSFSSDHFSAMDSDSVSDTPPVPYALTSLMSSWESRTRSSTVNYTGQDRGHWKRPRLLQKQLIWRGVHICQKQVCVSSFCGRARADLQYCSMTCLIHGWSQVLEQDVLCCVVSHNMIRGLRAGYSFWRNVLPGLCYLLTWIQALSTSITWSSLPLSDSQVQNG
jgi:hypothetical protein